MIYLDTTILVPALHSAHENHNACLPFLLNPESVTSAHALAESFSALTGGYKVRNDAVAEILEDLAGNLRIEPIAVGDYVSVLRDVKRRAIMGGLIYDAIHVAVARRLKASRLLTYNLADFIRLAPDLKISAP